MFSKEQTRCDIYVACVTNNSKVEIQKNGTHTYIHKRFGPIVFLKDETKFDIVFTRCKLSRRIKREIT